MKTASNTPDQNNNISSEDIKISDVSYTQETNKTEETTIIASHTEFLSGPLPHPRLLQEYNKIIKDGAERIMIMAEKQQESRITGERETRETNRHIAERQIKLQQRGQILASIVILLILGLVALFTFTGHETVAYILLGIGLASIISAFTAPGIKKKDKDDK